MSTEIEMFLPRCNKWRAVLHRLTVTDRCEEISNRNQRRVFCDYFESVREFLEQLIVVFFKKISFSFNL